MLSDEATIRAVLLTLVLLAVLRDKTVIQMGTIAQEESLALQAEIERVSGSYCEAPVLGSLAEAQVGTLFVMVGGTEEQFVQWGPLFGSLSREPCLAGAGADHCAGTWRFQLFRHLRGRQPDSIASPPPASLLPAPASDRLARDRAPF